jgi:hypothetical protein
VIAGASDRAARGGHSGVLLPVAQVAIRWAPPQPYVELPHFLIAFKAIVDCIQSNRSP